MCRPRRETDDEQRLSIESAAPRDGVLISGAGSQRLDHLDCTLLGRFAPTRTCYSAPNVCSSQPELCGRGRRPLHCGISAPSMTALGHNRTKRHLGLCPLIPRKRTCGVVAMLLAHRFWTLAGAEGGLQTAAFFERGTGPGPRRRAGADFRKALKCVLSRYGLKFYKTGLQASGPATEASFRAIQVRPKDLPAFLRAAWACGKPSSLAPVAPPPSTPSRSATCSTCSSAHNTTCPKRRASRASIATTSAA